MIPNPHRSATATVLLLALLLALTTVLLSPVESSTAEGASGEPYLKVIAAPGLFAGNGQNITLWHDYGTYALYRVAPAEWWSLPEQTRAQAQVLEESYEILIAGNALDTRVNAIQEDNLYRAEKVTAQAPGGYALHLVQFVGPIKSAWLAAVEATGSQVVQYIPHYAYLVWANESGRRQLAEMAAEQVVLQFSGPYAPSLKYGLSLSDSEQAGPRASDLVTVTIQMLRHEARAQSEAVLEALFVQKIADWQAVLDFQNAIAIVRRGDLATIARLPDVVWVGEYFGHELLDESQGQVIAGNLNAGRSGPSGPGYIEWLLDRGFNAAPGNYPLVDITDDGIGNGVATAAGGDSTLRLEGDPAKASRIAYIANCTDGPDGGSPNGHGHINVSIAGGYDLRSGFPFADSGGYQLGLGINPFGRFAGTRVFDGQYNLGGCGGSYTALVQQSYERGARIISNSWGCFQCAGTYDDSSQAYDAAVRDADPATAGNQELLILFSAGNNGPSANTISTPGNAKNVLTVGATEGVRSLRVSGCPVLEDDANNIQDIVYFSSRGPAPGNRIKPDVVAPGSHIQGTASTHPSYDGTGICGTPYFPAGQQVFTISSGTSHSTPAVAGLASLASAWIDENFNLVNASPALLKAFIAAHTSYLEGAGAADDLPSPNQGYGLPDMSLAFGDTPQVLLEQSQGQLLDESGQRWSTVVQAADPAKPVHIVMAYTDAPGMIGASPQVNDLDLRVQAEGQTFYGNHISGRWSIPGGSGDRANNVEAIFLPAVASTMDIEVLAHNIAGDGLPQVGDSTDQDFAIVCSNCVMRDDFTLQVSPQAQSVCAGEIATYSLATAPLLNFNDQVTLSMVELPAGVEAVFDPRQLTPPAESELTLRATAAAQADSYRLQVVGRSASRQHAAMLGYDLFTAIPPTPRLLSPPAGAANQPLPPQLTWSAVSQGATYDVQVASDSDFTQIVSAATDINGTAFTANDLEAGQIYYWRVRARNACGAGSFTAAATFSTMPAPGACPAGVQSSTLYKIGFEEDGDGWTSGGTNDTWQRTTTRAHSGSFAFHARNLDRSSDQRLLSPPISLPHTTSALTLQFWNYQSLERDADEDYICYDGAVVEISTDNGLTWVDIATPPPNGADPLLTDPYDGYIAGDFNNPLATRKSWCGDPQDWLNSVVNIDRYAGSRVRFRFRLGTDDSVGREGWFVDDVRVQSCPAAKPLVFLPFTVGP